MGGLTPSRDAACIQRTKPAQRVGVKVFAIDGKEISERHFNGPTDESLDPLLLASDILNEVFVTHHQAFWLLVLLAKCPVIGSPLSGGTTIRAGSVFARPGGQKVADREA